MPIRNIVEFSQLRPTQQAQAMDQLIKALGFAFIEENTPDYTAVNLAKMCTACNGSGHYDAQGSPLCAACGGLGYDEV